MKGYETLESRLDRVYGKPGTPERDAYEAEVEAHLDAYFLGQSVKDARVARNLTQEQLGEMIGVQKSQICRIERGYGVSLTTLRKIFRSLGLEATLNTGIGTYRFA